MRFWLVNQGTSFEDEKNGGFIYAPKMNSNGSTFAHWTDVKRVKKGDVIFSNKKGNIVAIGIAMSNGFDAIIPDSLKGQWYDEGYQVDIDYHLLSKPFCYRDYKDEYMKNIELDKNPFTVNGTAKMGYLYPMEEKIAKILLGKINDQNINKIIFMNDILFLDKMEELTEEKEQFEEISRGLVKGYNAAELKAIDGQKYIYETRIETGKEKTLREKTDPKLKATRMELSNYNCEINCKHKTFNCASGKHQYLECHHIIPLNAQKDFPNVKLDSMFNLIALCPICHSQVHYATLEEKKRIFFMMYEKRKLEMLERGFDLTKINEIFNKYYLKKIIVN